MNSLKTINAPKVFIETYGCTFNKADSQIIAGKLAESGVELVDTIEEADLAIVNTCYVKNPTESKVTNRIQKLQEKFPNKKIVVSGCMVEIDPEKLNKIAPNASWIGPHKLNYSDKVVFNTLNGEVSRECGFTTDSKVGVPKISFDSHIHIIQICEGCLGACTYCCTRFARGKLVSYPIADIVKEAEFAIKNGAVEIQLTAQDTAAFGKDTGEKLSDLIKEVSNIYGDFRIRVGMMHPKNIMNDVDEVIGAFKNKNVYKFLHLPIQTGSNKVLNEMTRGHNVGEYKNIVNKFKEAFPNLTLATDIIVGYPTENDEDFQKTVDFLEELRPNLIHLSKYKHRKGAISSNLEEIPHSLMKKRSKYLTDIKVKITDEENKELLNSIQKILITEKGRKSGFIGKTNSYIPVVVSNGDLARFVDVKITETTSTYIRGEII